MHSFCKRPLALILILLAASIPSRAQPPETALRQAFKNLIAAENLHDEDAVRALTWNSPSTLFVAKAPEGWRGYWGTDAVNGHLHEMYQHPFQMDPDYDSEKVVMLDDKVAETYVSVRILSQYGGFNTPKPFVMVLLWVSSPDGWKMATDLPIPVPPSSPVIPSTR